MVAVLIGNVRSFGLGTTQTVHLRIQHCLQRLFHRTAKNRSQVFRDIPLIDRGLD